MEAAQLPNRPLEDLILHPNPTTSLQCPTLPEIHKPHSNGGPGLGWRARQHHIPPHRRVLKIASAASGLPRLSSRYTCTVCPPHDRLMDIYARPHTHIRICE